MPAVLLTHATALLSEGERHLGAQTTVSDVTDPVGTAELPPDKGRTTRSQSKSLPAMSAVCGIVVSDTSRG